MSTLAFRDLLFTLAFVGFAGVTTLLLVLTIRNRLRAPQALLTWTDRKVWRSAVWPAGFVMLMGICAVLAADGLHPFALWQVVGLMVCGMNWLAAVVLANTVLVTETGIVTNINHPERTIVWEEVADYFDGGPAPWHYAFFYQDAANRRIRQDVWVPRPLRRAFGEIVGEALEHRFEVATPESPRRRTLG